jgi:hypothetical protein
MTATEQEKSMATVHIESADHAEQTLPDAERAKVAEAEAAEADKRKPAERFVEYVVPRRATASYVDEHGKRRTIASRPSEGHRHASVADDGSNSSRVGGASARARITPQDWAANGITGATQTLVWDFANSWRVPASALTTEQIAFLLEDDARINKLRASRFELVDGHGNKVDR